MQADDKQAAPGPGEHDGPDRGPRPSGAGSAGREAWIPDGPLGLRRSSPATAPESAGDGDATWIDVRPPGSKSIAQRLLLAAAACDGSTQLAGVPRGGDVEACLELVRALGAEVKQLAPSAFEIRGRAPGRNAGLALPASVSVGESGTLARLASGLIGLGSGRGECTLVPAGSLRGRRSAALFRTLEAAGVGLVFGDSDPAAGFGTWPVRLRPMGPPATLRLVAPASSQEVSALLFGTAAHAGETLVEVEGLIPSEPYVELSRAALAAFGASVERVTADGRTNYTVRGPLQAPEQPLTVEVDASLAGVVLAAACLTEQRVRVRGVGGASAQGDVRMVEHLRAFGCVAGASVDGPLQSLVACGPASRAADLDLTGEPDLAPPLAIVAADAARRLGATSRLRGLGTLPGKESDRIEVLRTGLERAGFAVDATRDALTIAPGAAPSAGAAALLLDPACDHRMAFAFGLLGLIDARVYVTEPGCVAKSWPGFWTALQPLGVVAVPAPRG